MSAPSWQQALERLPQPAFALDAQARFVWLNESAQRLFTPPGECLLGRLYLERVHPDDREGAIQRYRRLMQGEVDAYQAEVRYLAANEQTLWLRVATTRLPSARSQEKLFLATAHVLGGNDIRHAVLERSERQLKLALEASRGGVWDWDLGTDIVEYSDSFKRLLRYPDEPGFHQAFRFRDRLHPQDRERALLAVQQAIAQRVDFDIAYRLLCFDGHYHWFRGRGRAYYDHLGQPMRFCGVLLDWAEQHAFERQLKQAEQRQRYLASHDELTGLMNRRAWLEVMAERLRSLGETGRLAVLLIDLDGFKDVNDSLGHHVGDQLLQELSRRMSRLVGPMGLLARLGGDEFVCCVVSPDAQTAAADLAEILIDGLSRPWKTRQGHVLSVGASVGIAIYPTHGRRVETLLRGADAALYTAKAAGRGTHRFCDRILRQQARERLRLETRLRRAIHEGTLYLLYQPVRDFESGQMIGAEALLRWQDEELGMVSPARFIPVAEALGLMPAIGQQVREQAFAALALWRQHGWASAQLAINVSVRELIQNGFADKLLQELERQGLPPSTLMLEITESVLLESVVHGVLTRMQAQGVRLAIDDFGLGYSSLARLRELEVDAVKIDRTFLLGIDDVEQQDHRLCSAIIAMAHSLGIEVIAEGVERHEQWQALKVLDCDRFQGYLDGGEPVSADALLARWRSEQEKCDQPASRRQAS